jgi:hypothetical protein
MELAFSKRRVPLRRSTHPHICQIYDVGPDYLVLEYIEGNTLRGPLPHSEAVTVALRIASALGTAHAKGILHRDLKPANILMTASGAKLLDFGPAKIAADDNATQTIGVAGTPLYMSPEQAEGKPLDSRSDVFSFGAVLYRLDPASLGKSFDCIQRALTLDPQYALAQDFLGGWYGLMAWSGLADPREMAQKGRAVLRKALELDPNLGHANAILGVWAGVADYDWQQAALHFSRAFELDGTSPEVRQSYAIWHLRPLGRLDEALAELDAMRHEDPLSVFVRTEVAHVLLLLRRYDAVAEIAQGTLDLEPNHTMSMFHLIHARIEQGRNEEAIQVAEQAAQLAPQWLVALTFLAFAYARGGRMDDAAVSCKKCTAWQNKATRTLRLSRTVTWRSAISTAASIG